MQSEHLSNLHPGWVVGGWLAAVAVTAALYLAGVGLGLAAPDSGAVVWVGVSMGGGFFVGGLLVGMRWSDAQILHGAAITFLSVLVWFLVLIFGGPGDLEPMATVLGLILLQLVAACAGGWVGRRAMVGGGGS
ncbi:MAG: hypothetical protein FJ207_04995 [Gemmatimonadetes bacterium]|nr:hypothetical protein [Gemmatimonadota bacterium]